MEFKEFEQILKETIKEFPEINKFGFIGLVGSLDIKKDLDILFAPSKNIKEGESLKMLCGFLDLLKNKLKTKKTKLIVFPYSIFQEEVEYLSKRKEEDILLHLVNAWDLVQNNKDIIAEMTKETKCYHGKIESLFEINKTDLDYLYTYLFFINCLYSEYPKKLETKKIFERIHYFLKNIGEKINFKNRNNKQIYFECCDILDSKAKEI